MSNVTHGLSVTKLLMKCDIADLLLIKCWHDTVDGHDHASSIKIACVSHNYLDKRAKYARRWLHTNHTFLHYWEASEWIFLCNEMVDHILLRNIKNRYINKIDV